MPDIRRETDPARVGRGSSIDRKTTEGLVEIAVFRMNHETFHCAILLKNKD